MNKLSFILMIALVMVSLVNAGDLEDGYEYFYLGDYQNAITSFESALSTAPASEKPKINYSLGVCYEKLQNIDRALTYYQRAGSYQDAPQAVARIQGIKNQQRVTSLRNEAQQALDDRNYGVAEQKALDILDIDRNNSWAINLLEQLDADTQAVSLTIDEASDSTVSTESIEQVPDSIAEQAAEVDSLKVAGGIRTANLPPWLIAVIIGGVLILTGAGFLGGMYLTVTKKKTISRAMKTLIKLLPAGMLSVRSSDRISMVFFEKGEVIKALQEEEDGVKIGGRNVAEEILGPGCEYNDKGKGPWSKFADLMIEIYHRSRGETEKKKTTKAKRK